MERKCDLALEGTYCADCCMETERKNNLKFISAAIGAAVYVLALAIPFSPIYRFMLYLTAYMLLGTEVLYKAGKNVVQGKIFNENFLMGIATLGAFAIGEYAEGVAVMLFYQIGEFLQDKAVNRSRRSIAALLDIRPESAIVIENDITVKKHPEEVLIGEIILVKPGERIPLDGIVIKGRSDIDTSALTGESIPKAAEPGTAVYSGTVNLSGVLTIKVNKSYQDSAVAKILDLVEKAGAKKARAEKFITRFAKVYTPVVIAAAVLLAVLPPLVVLALNSGVIVPEQLIPPVIQSAASMDTKALFYNWIYRALVFLVISCPCALVISIPLSFFGGIGRASRNGVLVKGANYLDALNHVGTVVFDKTGTLTNGVFKVVEIVPAGQMREDEILYYAALAESYSNHPIANSIVKASGGIPADGTPERYREIPGYGVSIIASGKEILVGNADLMKNEGINPQNPESGGTVVHVAVDGLYAGYMIVSDTIKEDSKETIRQLRGMGIKTVMLTGDKNHTAVNIGKELGIDEVHSELLPDEKVDILERIVSKNAKNRKTLYVGDGINDAPVLARAEVGVAMGALGSDAAIEAADIVLMTDEPGKLITSIEIAGKTRKIVWQNIILAFAVKILVLVLGAGGMATMWEAVFADVGVALIAVLNSIRLIGKRTKFN
ncbi:MAG TPA: heavy metal translocating P-type ATPase [Clostridia bacterium]